MAPSPTGEFHIGGLRTLLYNWAFARQTEGKFIIRIEDTDRARLVDGAVERILEVIKDYGFDWDEGPVVGGPQNPYVQSERLSIYKKYLDELIDAGHAYYCFCTQERLQKVREEKKSKGDYSTKYDRHCLNLTKEEIEKKLSEGCPYVVRFKVPDNKKVVWTDGVLGEVSIESVEIDDQILMKSDGFPTYHFAVVVDDHLMGITHVMRGNEWLPSTPKHVLLYEAFGWQAPIFCHLPNLKELGENKKLSKRHGPVSAKGFLEEGYLPEAVVNYLMFLGWNPGGEKEIFSLEEFIKLFDVKKIHRTDLVAFDRTKLLWINSQYIQKLSDMEFVERVKTFSSLDLGQELLAKIAPLVKPRIKKLIEFDDLVGFFKAFVSADRSLFSQNLESHAIATREAFEKDIAWDVETIGAVFSEIVAKNSFQPKDYFMDMRLVVCGKKITPPLNESILILGKEEFIDRIKKSLGGN